MEHLSGWVPVAGSGQQCITNRFTVSQNCKFVLCHKIVVQVHGAYPFLNINKHIQITNGCFVQLYIENTLFYDLFTTNHYILTTYVDIVFKHVNMFIEYNICLLKIMIFEPTTKNKATCA